MLQQQKVPASGKIALMYGLIFGGIIGLIDIIYSVVLDTTNPPFLTALYQAFSRLSSVVSTILLNLIIGLPIYILLFVALLLAGLFASRKTKKVSTGMLAALWGGACYLVVDVLIVNVLLTYLIVFPQEAQYGLSASEQMALENSTLTNGVLYALIAGLVLVAIGVGVGALGGLIGKGGATPAVQTAPSAYQPYQPYQDSISPPPYQSYQRQGHTNPYQYSTSYGQNMQPQQAPPPPDHVPLPGNIQEPPPHPYNS